jgi:hypothetical protein
MTFTVLVHIFNMLDSGCNVKKQHKAMMALVASLPKQYCQMAICTSIEKA